MNGCSAARLSPIPLPPHRLPTPPPPTHPSPPVGEGVPALVHRKQRLRPTRIPPSSTHATVTHASHLCLRHPD